MDIINIMDRLEALITTSLRVPVTQRTLLDGKKVQELMDQLRLVVPQDVKAAEEILMKKDEILNHAEAVRRHAKTQAEEEFRVRLQQTEVMKEAKRKSDEILEEADRKTTRMISQADIEVRTKRTEADAYAAKTLHNLERQLASNLTSIRNGMALLTGLDTFQVIASGKKE